MGASRRITWSSCRRRCSGTVHGSCSTWRRRHSWISRWCASSPRMKGTASSCCVARDTSGSGSLGSGAKEPKETSNHGQRSRCLDRSRLRPRANRLSEGDTGFNGPTRPAIISELPGVPVLDRTTMNAFEDRAFREAVKKTGRKRLIFGGLHTEICLTFAAVQALKDGYEAMFVADAVGGRSQTAHRTAIERLSHLGAVPNTALAVLCELFRDWTSPLANKAREVIAWYFAEIPKLTADVGV